VIGIFIVSTIALLCLVVLCTPVQLDCSLAALQADLLFTPVNTCSMYSLEALQANFKDPFLGPPTHSCKNILLAFELYEIKISVATSICRLLVILLTISSSFIRLLINEQLRLPCRLLVILLMTSSSFIILLIDEQLQLPCCLLVLYCSLLAVLVLYCSSLSSCDFHVNLYYYTAHQ
jgi:hypothetical protein